MGDRDDAIRAAALLHVQGLVRRHGTVLHWSRIHEGFSFEGQQVHLATRAKGIFRPAQMSGPALSIKSTVARTGRIARYDDQLQTDSPILLYKYMGNDPSHPDNRMLREAWIRRSPLIYLYGQTPSHYSVVAPCYVVGDHPGRLTFDISVEAVSSDLVSALPYGNMLAQDRPVIERRYSTVEAKVRLHQDRFREVVLQAYEERCAVCILRERLLLDAAHIIPDREEHGVPETRNGLALCNFHHAAYDRDLLGIRPDLVVVLNDRLMDAKDGPMLQHGLKDFHGKRLGWLPRRREDAPGQEFLQERWEQFEKVG